MWKKNKYLLYNKKKITGRDKKGTLILYYRGGGVKNIFRIIDFKKYIWNIYGIILRIEYDPNRYSLINSIIYTNGILCYILSTKNLLVGDFVISSLYFSIKTGYSNFLKNLKSGDNIHTINFYYNKKLKYTRTFGGFSILMNKLNNGCIVKLKSKQKVFISNFCFGTKGSINSNIIKRQKYRKASYFIYLGWKSHIRGVAMNPIDHPHGGGQGKTSGGRPSSSPWGWYTKGIKTKTKKYSGKIYLKR